MSAPPVRDASPLLTRVAQDEVLTGEGVALDVQPVGVLMRTLGAVIDLLLGLAILIPASIWVLGSLPIIIGQNAATIVNIGIIVLVMVVLPTVVETASGGRSLGRLTIGARIVRWDGGASGFRQALIRALVGVFEIWLTLGSIAVLTGVFTPRSQRLGDLAAGTYAQRTRVPALPVELPGVPPGLEEWAAVADVARLPDRLARRLSQFLRQLDRLQPGARERIATQMLADAAPFVSPMPPADPIRALFAISAVRREREFRALMAESARVQALAPVLERTPHNFPRR